MRGEGGGRSFRRSGLSLDFVFDFKMVFELFEVLCGSGSRRLGVC